jgi:S-adenosylmethionine/arginine decarboxylase-like enzyme
LDSSHTHLTAEFHGVSGEQLRDSALLGGMLIAAASAAGFSTIGVPSVRKQPGDGVSAILLMPSAHIALHSLPERGALLFDIVGPASHDFRRALDVFARRLSARDITSDLRGRG